MQKAAVGGQQALPVQRELPLHAATGKSALSPALPSSALFPNLSCHTLPRACGKKCSSVTSGFLKFNKRGSLKGDVKWVSTVLAKRSGLWFCYVPSPPRSMLRPRGTPVKSQSESSLPSRSLLLTSNKAIGK